jgi:RNA polymerase sigma factor (sigma-70 family)
MPSDLFLGPTPGPKADTDLFFEVWLEQIRTCTQRHGPEVFQEVLLKVWRESSRFLSVPAGDVFFLLNSLARDQGRLYDLREQRRNARLRKFGRSRAGSDAAPSAAEVAEGRTRERELAIAIGALPARLVVVVEWRYFDGLTWTAIGDRMGCSATYARKAHRRALELLRKMLPRPD